MSLQNGLGHEDILSEEVGRDRVMTGKTYVGGVLLAPDHVRSGSSARRPSSASLMAPLDGTCAANLRDFYSRRHPHVNQRQHLDPGHDVGQVVDQRRNVSRSRVL